MSKEETPAAAAGNPTVTAFTDSQLSAMHKTFSPIKKGAVKRRFAGAAATIMAGGPSRRRGYRRKVYRRRGYLRYNRRRFYGYRRY